MFNERRKSKRHPCTAKIGIFLAQGEQGVQASATLSGNLIDLSLHGAGLILPQILDHQTHLAYAAMESKELILHLELYHGEDKKIIVPTKPAWFNRSLSEHLTPFRLGVEFIQHLLPEQIKLII